MTTFSVLMKCLPFLGFLGFGLYLLLTALVPSWREKGWNHWKAYLGYDAQYDEKSWLVQLGFVQPPKPIEEGDFKVRTAVWLYSLLGAIFIAIGVGGIVLIVRTSIQQ